MKKMSVMVCLLSLMSIGAHAEMLSNRSSKNEKSIRLGSDGLVGILNLNVKKSTECSNDFLAVETKRIDSSDTSEASQVTVTISGPFRKGECNRGANRETITPVSISVNKATVVKIINNAYGEVDLSYGLID